MEEKPNEQSKYVHCEREEQELSPTRRGREAEPQNHTCTASSSDRNDRSAGWTWDRQPHALWLCLICPFYQCLLIHPSRLTAKTDNFKISITSHEKSVFLTFPHTPEQFWGGRGLLHTVSQEARTLPSCTSCSSASLRASGCKMWFLALQHQHHLVTC